MSEHIIDLINITKSYGDNEIIKDMSLYIRKNEFLTLLGPSGCGKTTTLRMIAGFEKPDSGKILFNGQDIANLPPNKRNVNTVFQKYSLFPHMNIYENIAFGLRIKKMKEEEIKEKVTWALDLVALQGFEKRNPDSLSGGQQQRIAIARALVNEPEVLLLDEPLGALDLKLRKEMQLELKAIQQKTGITFIYVTHDQEEALTMSDTIVVMNQGVIQQIGIPTDIYNEPVNAFVARFIGESNLLSGVMLKDRLCEFAGKEFVCVDTGFDKDEDVDIVIRPEDIKITTPEDGQLKGIVNSTIFKGVHYEMVVESEGFNWKVHSTKATEPGTEVGMRIDPFDIQIMRIPYNILTGWVNEDNLVEIGDDKFQCTAQGFEKDETVSVYILPQDIELYTAPRAPQNKNDKKYAEELAAHQEKMEGMGNTITGEVENFRYKGDDYEINVRSGDLDILVHTYTKVSIGETVTLHIPAGKIKIRKREELADVPEQAD